MFHVRKCVIPLGFRPEATERLVTRLQRIEAHGYQTELARQMGGDGVGRQRSSATLSLAAGQRCPANGFKEETSGRPLPAQWNLHLVVVIVLQRC